MGIAVCPLQQVQLPPDGHCSVPTPTVCPLQQCAHSNSVPTPTSAATCGAKGTQLCQGTSGKADAGVIQQHNPMAGFGLHWVAGSCVNMEINNTPDLKPAPVCSNRLLYYEVALIKLYEEEWLEDITHINTQSISLNVARLRLYIETLKSNPVGEHYVSYTRSVRERHVMACRSPSGMPTTGPAPEGS